MERFHTILIKDFMTKDPFVLTMGEPMADAYEKMHDHHIRHLPVVDRNGNLVGMFSATDLSHAYKPRETENGWFYDKESLNLLNLEHFMTRDPLTVTPENSLKDAARIMADTKYGCLPVVALGTKKLVGIISYVDILREIAKIF